MKKILIALLWIACAIHNWGFTLGETTHHYPMSNNIGISLFTAASGPFGVPAVFCVGLDSHWMLSPLSTEERWQAFHKRWPSLDRDEFEETWN